ncbi:acyl-CoA synthetase [Roseomonas genomospecies 6]|uniref:3-methylmercaptopropionyl-CoA ligase n=1 Tax=Roseomonas genomospecies 6 TaxID=214106 RepID=A0A9W7KPX4_9PROT|nr:acyl-CoA synthetase [Roseomonas genomospecies 6]KAA0676302.1 acyl-CoA synthetase [Roseomonas genomospecies 6]
MTGPFSRTASIYDRGLAPDSANHVPLSPLSFLKRAAKVYPDKPAILHGRRTITYAQFHDRVRRFAGALLRAGVGRGDTVSVLAPNVPALLEAHYAVPLAGAVLNALNTRLDAAAVAFILDHSETKLLIVDRELSPVAKAALALTERPITVVEIADALVPDAPSLGAVEYEDFLAAAEPAPWRGPDDEWQAIALNYTSGTTGNPKGVVYHHRGAYLNALGNAFTLNVRPESVFLWTLPMFHCNGWTYSWAVTAAGGTHVCLRRVEPAAIFDAIAELGVTHLCGAPIVLNMLIHAPETVRRRAPRPVIVGTGGAAPPSAVLAGMAALGFEVVHMYGLTECYGPATVCAPQPEWNGLDSDGLALQFARQGVNHIAVEDATVLDRESGQPVPADALTIGEIALRGNTVMKGYLKNPTATKEALKDGWFRTGDLGVLHPDGYIEVKDRSKDIIISGGENISSLEVEEALYRHPAVLEAAVVARPDDRWGESPCAFVTVKPGAERPSESDIIQWCRDRIAHYKVPRTVVFSDLPKTSTGKIQKTVLRDAARDLGARREAQSV